MCRSAYVCKPTLWPSCICFGPSVAAEESRLRFLVVAPVLAVDCFIYEIASATIGLKQFQRVLVGNKKKSSGTNAPQAHRHTVLYHRRHNQTTNSPFSGVCKQLHPERKAAGCFGAERG